MLQLINLQSIDQLFESAQPPVFSTGSGCGYSSIPIPSLTGRPSTMNCPQYSANPDRGIQDAGVVGYCRSRRTQCNRISSETADRRQCEKFIQQLQTYAGSSSQQLSLYRRCRCIRINATLSSRAAISPFRLAAGHDRLQFTLQPSVLNSTVKQPAHNGIHKLAENFGQFTSRRTPHPS